MAIESEVDVGRESFGMVNSQHALKDQSSLVLVGESMDRIVHQVVHPCHLSIAVGDVDVDGTVCLDEHLESIFEQFKGCLEVT